MELNKDIRDVLIELAMITKENNYTNSQILIRSTYDTFRIQNIFEKLATQSVGNHIVCDGCGDTGRGIPTLQEPDGVDCQKCISK